MSTPDDIDRLAADWIALWEGETAALAQDRELAEGWAAGVALMAAAARAQAAQFALLLKWAAPREPANVAPGSPPAGAAHDAGGDAQPGGTGDAATLRSRIAELEQRLAALESGGGGADRPARRRKRDLG